MEREQTGSIDSEVLGFLLKETWAPLVLYLLTFLDSVEAAEDAAQEAFVRLWEHRDQWESGSARAVVFRIGRNVALDLRRRAEVRRRWSRDHRDDAAPSPPTPEEVLAGKELLLWFREALESLPPRRREVFELIRLRGLSHRETAEVMDVSYRTVANHLRMAMKEMKHLLSDCPAEEPAESPASDNRGRAEGASNG